MCMVFIVLTDRPPLVAVRLVSFVCFSIRIVAACVGVLALLRFHTMCMVVLIGLTDKPPSINVGVCLFLLFYVMWMVF